MIDIYSETNYDVYFQELKLGRSVEKYNQQNHWYTFNKIHFKQTAIQTNFSSNTLEPQLDLTISRLLRLFDLQATELRRLGRSPQGRRFVVAVGRVEGGKGRGLEGNGPVSSLTI